MNQELSKAKKLLWVDIIFLILDFVITYFLIKLWYWLFDNKIIITILIILTLLGLMSQIWRAIGNLQENWERYKRAK